MNKRIWALIAMMGFAGAVQAQMPPPAPNPAPPPPRLMPPPACNAQAASAPGQANHGMLPSTAQVAKMLTIDTSRAAQVRKIMQSHLRAQQRVDDTTCASLKKVLGQSKLEQWVAQTPPSPPVPPAPPSPPAAPRPAVSTSH